jgi:hypothetical protein
MLSVSVVFSTHKNTALLCLTRQAEYLTVHGEMIFAQQHTATSHCRNLVPASDRAPALLHCCFLQAVPIVAAVVVLPEVPAALAGPAAALTMGLQWRYMRAVATRLVECRDACNMDSALFSFW